MKKVFSIIFLVTMILLLFSCGENKPKNREYDEEEVKSAAKLLIYSSNDLNSIFWGKGIDYIEGDESNGIYHEANPNFLDKHGFQTIEELKKITAEVYSDGYCRSIFSAVLNAYGDGEPIVGLTRYYQKYSDAYGKEPKCIMVCSSTKALFKDEVDYLLDTISVIGSEGDTVYVKLFANVTRDGKIQKREIEVGLIEEDDGWRIDTPTYTSYREDLEEKTEQ